MKSIKVGKCALVHGDCLDVLARFIWRGIKVDVIIADPPYAVLNKKCMWGYYYKHRRYVGWFTRRKKK